MNKVISFVFSFILMIGFGHSLQAQDTSSVQYKVNLLVEKAEYHRLTDGEQDGYRIKIHFGVERDKAKTVRTKFASTFNQYVTYEEYQQPNWVVLVGDFKTKIKAFEALKTIQAEFPNSFIVKGKIKVK